MEDPNVWKANYTPETKEMLKELSKVKPMILSSFPEVDMLGYKSPIEVIMSDIVMKEEDQVMQAVWNVGVNVDKAELVRALAYDRDQYAAGYQYAKKKYDRPNGEWKCLKEHITEMRDADGELNQKETCQFILNLMGVIEKEGDHK